MKRFVQILNIVVLMVLLCATVSLAAPFLVCDVQNGVDTYSVTTDGVEVTGVAVQTAWVVGTKIYFTDPGGTTRVPVHVLKDLATISTGGHSISAKACSNTWGCSVASVPFALTRYTLGAPTTISLVSP